MDEASTGVRIAGSDPEEVRESLFDGEIHTRDDVLEYQYPRPGTSWLDTVRSLARFDPKQSPVYYVSARAWVTTFGSSVSALRAFSALLGVLALPLVYLVARELFGDPIVGWIATGVVAVSPLHCTYARDARPYPLWVVVILLCSWLVLVAVRRSHEEGRVQFATFALYGGAMTLAFYTHPMSGLMAVAHAGYVAGIERCRWTPVIRATLIALGGAGLLYAPLGVRVVAQLAGPNSGLAWLTDHVGTLIWIRGVAAAASRVFLDFWGPAYPRNLQALGAVPLLLAIVAVFTVLRWAPARGRLFVMALGVSCSLPYVVVDMLAGGWRTWRMKYQFPAAIALELCVAFAIAYYIQNPHRWRRLAGTAAAAVFAVGGGVTCVGMARAQVWWSSGGGRAIPEVARQVNSAANPLLVAGFLEPPRYTHVLALARRLDDHVQLLLVDEPPWPQLPEGYGSYFAHHVSDEMLKWFDDQGWQVEKVGKRRLYRLRLRPSEELLVESSPTYPGMASGGRPVGPEG
jgi:uncharacterized membrane protein